MKYNVFRKIIYIVLISISLSSCSNMKIEYYGKKDLKVHNVALISTMIGRMRQPQAPIIEAGVFNEKTNNIADEIMKMQKNNIDMYRVLVAKSINRNLYCNVLYADSLHKLPGFLGLKEKYDFKSSLILNSDNFPYIITASNDINPFNYNHGMVFGYFKKNNQKELVAEIAKTLNCDLIAVSYSNLSIVDTDLLGLLGDLRLDTYILLFDKYGNQIVSAQTWSDSQSISGKQLSDYTTQIFNLSPILEPMMVEIGKFFKK